MKSFDEIFALATSPLHREYAETFTDPRLSWGVGVTQGVAVAMQEKQAEIDALKAQNAEMISTFFEVLRISDRQHDAWDAAKAAIAKARGDL